MASMFEEFNKTLKTKLIALYDHFIENPNDENLRENAATITQKYANSGNQISDDLNNALQKAYDLELGKLSKEEAKKILEDLKKSE